MRKITCPTPPTDIPKSLAVTTPHMLYMAMALTEAQVKAISNAIIRQKYCQMWVDQRNGRITASNIHDVFTKVNSVMKDPCKNTKNLVTKILGTQPSKHISTKPALKHGLE